MKQLLGFFILLAWVLVFLGARTQTVLGEEPSPDPAVAREARVSEKGELFVALLKRRAQRILESRRAPPPPLVSFSAGATQGYESNVNLDGARKGDYFTEETASVVLSPTWTSRLASELSANLSNTHYVELRDSNLWTNTFTGMLRFQPVPPLRLEAGAEYAILNFPFDSDSSFFDHRLKANLLWAFASQWTSKVGWVYQLREYDTRKARDHNANRIPLQNRQDNRHTVLGELKFRKQNLFARAGAEYYRNFSNEKYLDFYDWSDLKFRAALTYLLNPQWLGTLVLSHETKNYRTRPVPAINVAERDNLLTLAGSVIYQINKTWMLTYLLTYRYQDSNDPRLDFTDWVNQLGVSVNF